MKRTDWKQKDFSRQLATFSRVFKRLSRIIDNRERTKYLEKVVPNLSNLKKIFTTKIVLPRVQS